MRSFGGMSIERKSTVHLYQTNTGNTAIFWHTYLLYEGWFLVKTLVLILPFAAKNNWEEVMTCF